MKMKYRLEGEEIATKEAMKEQSLKRMRKLQIHESVINEFENSDKILCSENNKFIEVPPKIMEDVIKYSELFGNMIFHVLHSNFMNCELWEYLTVSPYPEDWEYENDLIDDMWTMSRSRNMTIPDFTESGSIKVINKNGVLKRVM